MHDVLIAIPARMQSSRFPGKPLAMKNGLPLVLHVVKRALQVTDRVIVCTDSHEVAEACRGECEVYLATCDDAWCGTARIGHAARALSFFFGKRAVVNWQVDEPYVEPSAVEEMLTRLESGQGPTIWTLVAPLSRAAAEDENAVKAKLVGGVAVDFFRAMPDSLHPVLHHVGVYGFTHQAFSNVAAMPPTNLAVERHLEQLAWPSGIGVVRLREAPLSINTREDYEKWLTLP